MACKGLKSAANTTLCENKDYNNHLQLRLWESKWGPNANIFDAHFERPDMFHYVMQQCLLLSYDKISVYLTIYTEMDISQGYLQLCKNLVWTQSAA